MSSRRFARRGTAALAGALLALALVGAASAATNTVVDLGTLGGQTSGAEAINAVGEVVGSADTSSGIRHAFSWSNGTITDLGTLGGASDAHGVNLFGAIVGDSQTAAGVDHAFLYRGGTMTDLSGSLPPSVPPGGESVARGINAAGEIVGTASAPAGGTTAFVIWPGNLLNETFGANTEGWGINGFHQAAGVIDSTLCCSTNAWFQSIPDYYLTDSLTDPSRAFAINDLRQIVGTIGDDALFWNTPTDPFTPHHLTGPFPVSAALALNGTGAAVGWSGPGFPLQPGSDAMEWLLGSSAAIDLNGTISPSDGWHLTSAGGVNDTLGIVGVGEHNGIQRAFLLTQYVWLKPPPPVPFPHRIQITLVAGPVRPAPGDPVARLYLAPIDPAGGVGAETRAIPYGTATDGNAFQRLPGGIYTFPLATAGLAPGSYQLRVDLGDGIAETTYRLDWTGSSATLIASP